MYIFTLVFMRFIYYSLEQSKMIIHLIKHSKYIMVRIQFFQNIFTEYRTHSDNISEREIERL